MSFSSILGKLGHEILSVFSFVDKVATVAQPFIAIAQPQIGQLLGVTLAAVANAEALGQAAAANSKTGPAKAASVIVAITPTVKSTLIALGVPEAAVTSAMIKAYTNAFVNLLNTIPAPADTPAPAK